MESAKLLDRRLVSRAAHKKPTIRSGADRGGGGQRRRSRASPSSLCDHKRQQRQGSAADVRQRCALQAARDLAVSIVEHVANDLLECASQR